MKHIFALNGTVISSSSNLNYNSYTFNGSNSPLQLRFTLPSDFLNSGTTYSLLTINFVISLPSGSTFTSSPTAVVLENGTELFSNTGTLTNNNTRVVYALGIGFTTSGFSVTGFLQNMSLGNVDIRFR